MRRMTGRHLGRELAVSIANLPDEKLFSASEVAYTRFDPKKTRTEYERLKNKLWKLANRNGLPENPDNCARDEENDPLLNEHGRPVLLKGERYPRYLGTTWKGLLYDEDWAIVKEDHTAHNSSQTSGVDQIKVSTPSSEVITPLAAETTIPKAPPPPQVLSADNPELPEIVGKAFQAYTWRRIRRLFSGPSWTISALLLCAVFLPAAVGGIRHGFDAVFAVYEKQGPVAALKLAVANKTQGLDQYFTAGWLFFQNRENIRSQGIMNQILEDPSAPDRFRARALYVLGSIDLAAHRYQEAEDQFQASIHFYEEEGFQLGVARNQIELANALWMQGYIDEAFALAEEAKKVVTSGIEIDKLYMRLFFETRDYEKSLEYAQKLLEDSRVSVQTTALLHIGYTATVMGNDLLAISANLKASALIESTGDINLRFYSFVNQIVYAECHMAESSELVELVTQYAIEKGEMALLDQMNNIQKLCELRY